MGTLDTHAREDLLAPGLKLVFCGAAAGAKSAPQQAYYAESQNGFWKTLHEVGLTPAQLEPENYTQLTQYGIGLTEVDDADALAVKITAAAPNVIAFNGLGAARTALGSAKVGAGRYPEPFAGAEVWVLPSTSSSAKRSWDVAVWQELAERVRALAEPAPEASDTPQAAATPKLKAPTAAKPTAPAAAKPKTTTAAKPKTTTAAKPKTTTAAKPKTTTAAKPKTTTAAKPKTKPTTAAKPKAPAPPKTATTPAAAPVAGAAAAAEPTAVATPSPAPEAVSPKPTSAGGGDPPAAEPKKSGKPPVMLVSAGAAAALAVITAIRRRISR